MNSDNRGRAARESGLTLVEILVAITILAIAAIIALTVYDLSRKSFKKGENLTEQQQAVRIAFDRLGADLRMAGYNYNPDGDRTRPDEQIEAAFDTALVLRADFDAEDPTLRETPETDLATGGSFLAVSTGNDEIVAYFLAKPDGSSSDTLSFDADISSPRDGTRETVSIDNVAMVHSDPPYTLYRATLNNDGGTFGSDGFVTRTPLIENVYAMNFRYLNQTGVQANAAFDLAGTADDIGGDDVTDAISTRAGIRRVIPQVVGLTRDPDLDYVDASDPIVATRKLRKFPLTGDITPRNLGLIGIRDIASDLNPPTQPGTPSLVPGHCGGLYVSWPDNPIEDQVAYYKVNFSTTAGSTAAARTATNNSYYLGGLTDATTYYVSIQAVDADGNQSVKSTEASVTTTNVNTPSEPMDGAASTDLEGVVRVRWTAVGENQEDEPAGDPASPMIRDLAGYRVYRSNGSSFGSAVKIADETVLFPQPSPAYPDSQVVNCRGYNYWVSAVDACGSESPASAEISGQATTDVAPLAPSGVQAFLVGSSDVKLQWEPVNTDVAGKSVFIDRYRVYRTNPMTIGEFPSSDADFRFIEEVSGATAYVDNAPGSVGGVTTVFYKVSATDDCPNESAKSEAVEPTCSFGGEVRIVRPDDGKAVAGVVPVEVVIDGATDTYARLILEFVNLNSGSSTTEVVESAGPSWTYNWLASPPGPYRIVATVENVSGCMKSDTIEVSAGTSVGCCLSQPNPELLPIVLECEGSGSAKCATVRYQIINNNCLTSVRIEQMRVTWVDYVGDKPKLLGVRFDGSLIWNVTPPSLSPAENDWEPDDATRTEPSIPVSRDSTFPVNVDYVFDKNMAKRGTGKDAVDLRDTFTTSYTFRLLDADDQPTSITGICGPSTGWFDQMVVEAP